MENRTFTAKGSSPRREFLTGSPLRRYPAVNGGAAFDEVFIDGNGSYAKLVRTIVAGHCRRASVGPFSTTPGPRNA